MKHILNAVVWNPYRSKRPLGFYNLIKGHTGCDLNFVFEPLVSPVSGIVKSIVFQPEMGQVIYLQDIELQNIHVFAHMSKVDVKVNQEIKREDVLGITGNTGAKSTQAHLHYEVLTFRKPDKKNPSIYDSLFNPIMTRNLEGFSGYNIDPIKYLSTLYGKYQISTHS